MRCKTKGRIGEMALKIDINKDFDKVHWNYLFKVMAQMGFHQKWISWMNYVGKQHTIQWWLMGTQ